MASASPIRTEAEAEILARFPGLKARLPGNGPVAARREAAMAAFSSAGLPHRRVEAWKYTDLRNLMVDAAPLAAAPSREEAAEALARPAALTCDDATTINLVNGAFAGVTGPLPEGVTVVPLAPALAEGHDDLAFMGRLEIAEGDAALGLNTAFMTDGALVRVAAGMRIERPLALRFVTEAATPVATAVRALVVVEAGASLTLVESHETRGSAHQPNSVVELSLGDAAKVVHLRGAAHHEGAIVLATLAAELGARAELDSVALAMTGAVLRQQSFVRFGGADARASLNGGMLLRDRQHADATLVVDHAAPGGVSRELFRTVADDHSTGVFQGKIVVRKDAQKTDGRMASNAVLLAEGAAMNNKPELEIFADDVQCAHGATCGALDDELLFYLMARGLPKKEAEALMIESFVGEVLDAIGHDGLHEAMTGQIESWLAWRSEN
jgi:Fe-S cluster assembly protein SufD